MEHNWDKTITGRIKLAKRSRNAKLASCQLEQLKRILQSSVEAL